MKAAQYKFMANFNSTENDSLVDSKSEQEINVPNDGYVSEESAPVCSFCRDPDSKSPVSFLILLQVRYNWCIFCFLILAMSKNFFTTLF